MEKQLTAEEVARVFAMHWNSKINYTVSLRSEDGSKSEGEKEYTKSVPEFLSLFIRNPNSISKHKLLLTPLAEITDDDCFQIATRTDYERKYDTATPDFRVGKIDNRGFNIGNESNSASFFWHSLHWRQYQYLILKGYDMPLWFGVNHWANGKTAIQLKIAIEKK